MFYCHEILQRRNGSFGVIWLAAMNNKSLTRREYEKVQITSKCKEIMAYILTQVAAAEGRRRKFSLYLSAQLMYGTTLVYKEQNHYLLYDCLEAQRKIRKMLIRHLLDVPDAPLLKKRKLCLPENFSFLEPPTIYETEISPHIRIAVDLIHGDTISLPRQVDQTFQMDTTANTVPKHTITIPERSTGSSSFNNPNFNQIAPENDLAPMAAGELDQLLQELDVSPIKHIPQLEPIPSQPEEIPVPEVVDPIVAMREQLERTPVEQAVAPAAELPANISPEGKKRKRADDDEVTLLKEGEATPHKKRKRSTALVLPPLEKDVLLDSPKVPRTSKLLIDEPRRISKAKWKVWYGDTAPTIRPPILPDDRQLTVGDLMTQPACKGSYNSISMKAWFSKLCDSIQVTAVLPGEPRELPRNVSQLPDESGNISRELPRLSRTRSGAGDGISTSNTLVNSILDTPSAKASRRTTQEPNRSQVVSTPLPEPVVAVEDLMPPPEQPLEIPIPDQPLELPIPDQPEPAPAPLVVPEVDIPPVAPDADPTIEPTRQSVDPSLVIQSEAASKGASSPPPTPRTLSIKAKLTKSIKAHLQLHDTIAFTELHDIIRPGKTPRLEVAQLFHCLLDKAKNGRVKLTQKRPYAPIMIESSRGL